MAQWGTTKLEVKLQYPLKKDLFLLFLIMCMCTQVCAGAQGSQRLSALGSP